MFIVFALFVAAAVALPVSVDDADDIEYQQSDNIGVGPYKFGYKTKSGKVFNEEGALKNVGTENEALEVRGQYSYPGPDGVVYTVTYIANEFGYQPEGAHIPKA